MMDKTAILQIRIPVELSLERWILKEIFLRIGLPFTFVEEWNAVPIKIAYGFNKANRADLILREKSKKWAQVFFPEISRIENHNICHLADDKPTRLFSNHSFNVDIVGMGEYFLSGNGVFSMEKNSKTEPSDFGYIFKEPFIDNTCVILKKYLHKLTISKGINASTIKAWPDNKVAIAVTHDIDHLSLGGLSRFYYNTVFGRENKTYLLKQFIVSFKELLTYGLKAKLSPIQRCIDLEMNNSVRATYFIYTGKKNFPYNPSYGFDNKIFWDKEKVPLGSIIGELIDRGFEFGLHASTLSATNAACLSREINKMVNSGISQPFGIRYHRLRFNQNITSQILSQYEIKYDSSLGFNRKEGFAYGTAYPFYLYNEKNRNNERQIIEIPITLQDFHLIKAFKVNNITDTIEDILISLKEGEGGIVNLIWHPERFLNKSFGERLFGIFSEFISNNTDHYWFATLSEIASRWRYREEKIHTIIA